MSSSSGDDQILPGDIVSVNNGVGRKEGLVVGSHWDYAIVEVQLEPGDIYHACYPTVTRVKRTISYNNPNPHKHRTIQRTIYW
ncbi:unnamed protein product [Somion occarium]|uniref:Uncharacterized protein n=1 Tax=Somion occarium TaxID=3059160 RepID=A0ABP1CZ61_9APHY